MKIGWENQSVEIIHGNQIVGEEFQCVIYSTVACYKIVAANRRPRSGCIVKQDALVNQLDEDDPEIPKRSAADRAKDRKKNEAGPSEPAKNVILLDSDDEDEEDRPASVKQVPDPTSPRLKQFESNAPPARSP